MTPCIESINNCNSQGYPRITHKGSVHNEHRIVFSKYYGMPLDKMRGLVVRHTCDNRKCINPEHLELGTQKDNCQDKLSRGRLNGGGAPQAVSKDKALEIQASVKTQKQLALEYGISQPLVNKIKQRKPPYNF